VKPSGTLSLLGGATPGGHPSFAKYYIRRVRMSSTDGLVSVCRNSGYNVEYAKNFDGTESRDTVIVEFPCYSGNDSILSKNMSAIDQLNLVKKLQTEWSDNAVSVTIYYKKEELGDIKKWLSENYEKSVKSVSFCLHSDHGFLQAPYEEIEEEKYKTLISKVKSLYSTSQLIDNKTTLDVECSSGACPIR
jgi:hypothetical protein